MGAVITFPQAKRTLRAVPPQEVCGRAAVIILPVIRIERDGDDPPGERTEPSKSPSGGKRRRRASRP
jgi:hypothetical protein